MKKTILFAVFFLLFTGAVWAHPPSSVELTFTPGDMNLVIVARHNVQDPSTHYIKEYIIEVDGKEIQRIEMTRQENTDDSTATVNLPNVVKGSVIKVTGECNKFGENSASLTVE